MTDNSTALLEYDETEYDNESLELDDIESPLLTNYIEFFLSNDIIARRNGESKTFLFRGQADIDYKLQPSVFRRGLLKQEPRLIHELLIKSPEAFTPYDNAFQRLIKMQHYGLPTRLLDFTTNPLVALYFACIDKPDKDGEIIIVYDYLERFDSLDVLDIAILSEYQGQRVKEMVKFLEAKGGRKYSVENESERSIDLETLLQKVYIPVSAPLNNERIKRQQGTFVIANIGLGDRKNIYQKDAFDLKPIILENTSDEIKRSVRIPHQEKKEIIAELDAIGINKSFLFPEFEHQADYIKQKYEEV
jgi:hypothetical protein